jgi:hypothetical protein
MKKKSHALTIERDDHDARHVGSGRRVIERALARALLVVSSVDEDPARVRVPR